MYNTTIIRGILQITSVSVISLPVYADLSIWMRPCTVTECRNTCPGSSCLPPGTSVTVGIRCWSSVDETAGNVTTTVNVTFVQGSPFSSECITLKSCTPCNRDNDLERIYISYYSLLSNTNAQYNMLVYCLNQSR